MPILNMRRTLDMVEGERPLEWRIGIHDLNPNAAPLVQLVDRIGKDKSSDVEYFWWEKPYPVRILTVAGTAPAAGNAGTTISITVASGDAYNVVKGMVLQNTTTGEVLWVQSDPTTDDTVSVYRGVGATGSMPAMADGQKLAVIGTANAEGADVPTAISYQVTKKHNYLQTFRRATDNTRIALRTKLRTGDLKRRAQAEALLLLTTEKERAYLLGTPSEFQVAGDIVRTTGGLNHFITTHIYDASAGLTYDGIRGLLYDVAAEGGSDEKLLLATSDLFQSLEACFDDHSTRMRNVPKDEAFGMRLTSFEMGGVTVYVKHHRDLSRIPGYEGWGFLVDPDKLRQRILDDITWKPNRQNPGADRNIGEFYTDAGLEIWNEESFAIIKGATSYTP